MADKKTTKTASGAQQYVAGSNSYKNQDAINRLKRLLERVTLL